MPFKKGSTINLGRKASDETKKKMSLAKKGRKPSDWGAGFKQKNIPWNKRDLVARNAYYAGLIDGDGSIGIHGNSPDKKRYSRVSVRVTQATKDALVDGHKHWGGWIYKRKIKNRNEYFEWVTQHGTAARLLADIRPFLKLKKKQADIALRYRWIQMRKRTVNKISKEELKYRKELEAELKSLHLRKGRQIPS